MSTSRSSPYTPKISRRCASVTFFVSFSTTILALRCGGAGLRVALRSERVGVCEVRRGLRERLRVREGVRERDREADRGVIERRGVREGGLDAIVRSAERWWKVLFKL